MEKILQLRELLRPFRLHLMAAGIALALGMGMGLLKAFSSPPRLATADQWSLPQWAPFQAAGLKQELTGLTIFLGDPAKKKASEVVVAAPTWRFTGTMREGSQQIALISLDKGQRVKRILPGDELPGGAKVTAVRTGELVFTDTTGEQVLKLFSEDAKNPGANPKK